MKQPWLQKLSQSRQESHSWTELAFCIVTLRNVLRIKRKKMTTCITLVWTPPSNLTNAPPLVMAWHRMVLRQSEMLALSSYRGKHQHPLLTKQPASEPQRTFDFISFHLHEGCLSYYQLMMMQPLSCMLIRTRSTPEWENPHAWFTSFCMQFSTR